MTFKQKRRTGSETRSAARYLVGASGIEPPTTTMSR